MPDYWRNAENPCTECGHQGEDHSVRGPCLYCFDCGPDPTPGLTLNNTPHVMRRCQCTQYQEATNA